MNGTLPVASPVQGRAAHRHLARGMGWGMIGGLAGTLAMDGVLMAALPLFGMPALSCFVVVGDTMAGFLALLGVSVAGGAATGAIAHYILGPTIGAAFGAAVVKARALRVDTRKRAVLLAILYVELLSPPLLALAPLCSRMTTAEVLQWFGSGLVMHLMFGIVLGVIIGRGLRLPATGQPASGPVVPAKKRPYGA